MKLCGLIASELAEAFPDGSVVDAGDGAEGDSGRSLEADGWTGDAGSRSRVSDGILYLVFANLNPS